MELQSNQETKDTMAVVSAHIPISTLNVNEQNSPTERHRVAVWIKKQDPVYMLLTGDSPQLQRPTDPK